MIKRRVVSLIRLSVLIGIMFAGLLAAGCMAQQADVVRIKKELDAKIAKLDESKVELQAAVEGADKALKEANVIIAQQRGEIKELLQSRADLLDQVKVLRESDLSVLRGNIDQSLHEARTVGQKVDTLSQKQQAWQRHVQQREAEQGVLVKTLIERVDQQDETLHKQAETGAEFHASLLEFKKTLSAFRNSVMQQETRVQEAASHVEEFSQQTSHDAKQTAAYLDSVKQSVNSVATALERVGGSLTTRVDDHERRLHQLSSTFQERSASTLELHAQAKHVEALTRSVDQLRHTLDQVANQIATRVDAHEEELARLSQRSEHSLRIHVPMKTEVGTRTAKRNVPLTEAPSSESDSPELKYRELRAQLNAGDLRGALKGFSLFLRQYPNSPLAANAQYWIGECHYGIRQFHEAIQEFERVLAQYPSSEKVPAALLKIGYSHIELQDQATARSVFRQLIRTYPTSTEAGKAYARLSELDKPHQKAS